LKNEIPQTEKKIVKSFPKNNNHNKIMDAPPAIAKFYNNNNSNHFDNNITHQSNHFYDSNVIQNRTSANDATNTTLQMMSNPLHPLVDQLRQELRELKTKLAHAEEDKSYAVAQAKADTYVHIVRVLKQEGVPGVERLKTQYGGDAIAATLRHGGGLMLTGGGERRNTIHVAAPSVDTDVLTREELHSGLRKALRNL
jgi:hypothetical protein